MSLDRDRPLPSEGRTLLKWQIRNIKCEMALKWRKGAFKAWDLTSVLLHRQNHTLSSWGSTQLRRSSGILYISWLEFCFLLNMPSSHLRKSWYCKCWVLGSSPSPLATAFPSLAFGFGSSSQGEFCNLNQKKISIVVVVCVHVCVCTWAYKHMSCWG